MNQKKTTKPKYSLLQNIHYVFHTAWILDKGLLLQTFGLAILNLFQNLVQLFIAPTILQKVETAAPLSSLFFTILLFSLLLLVLAGLMGYLNEETLNHALNMRIVNHFYILGTEKLCTTSYPNIQDTNYIEQSIGAYFNIQDDRDGFINMITSVAELLQSLVGFGLYLLLLSHLEPLLLLIILITTVIGYFVNQRINEWDYLHKEESNAYVKDLQYIYSCIMENKMPKDIRIFGMQDWLMDFYNSALSLYKNFCNQREKQYLIANIIDVILLFLRNGIAYIYLIQMALTQHISAAEFLLYFSAVTGFTSWVTTILEHVIKLHRQSLNANRYRSFLEQEEPFLFEEGLSLEKDLSKAYEITLENVSFRYPNAKKDTISHMNLTIHSGEKLAIVGLNGAGKTTLVKLVSGFLDPTEGRVLLNGEDIRIFNRRDYYKLFAAVFQDFSRLETTIAVNVAQTPTEINYARTADCLTKAGLSKKITELPKGVETNLGRMMNDDGIELSGGENQRLMLARALYKNAPILVLDEPTAALDPIAENEIYLTYNEMTQGRTSLYISHRLASTQFCDRILYIVDGSIAEEGTHSQLLALSGGYANLYEVQSQYYREGDGTYA